MEEEGVAKCKQIILEDDHAAPLRPWEAPSVRSSFPDPLTRGVPPGRILSLLASSLSLSAFPKPRCCTQTLSVCPGLSFFWELHNATSTFPAPRA